MGAVIDGFRQAALTASDEQIVELTCDVRRALEGDSNDDEHDALVDVAQFFGIEYDPEAAAS